MQTTKIDLKTVAGTIKCEGSEIPFAQYVGEHGGGGDIFEDYYGDILRAAHNKGVQWNDVDDYVCPIVNEVLVYAVEEDQGIYMELMGAVLSAWGALKEKHDAVVTDTIIEVKSDGSNLPEALDELKSLLKPGDTIENIFGPAGGWYTIEIKKKEAQGQNAISDY